MLSEANKKALELVCRNVNAKLKCIGKESENQKIKDLIKSSGDSLQILNTKNTQNEECMIISGFSNKEIDRFLVQTRKYAIKIDLKCIVTEYNQDWMLCDLITELKKEHNTLHS